MLAGSLLLLLLLQGADAAGTKLWELGYQVEDNPLTVFIMFAFVVCLTIFIESVKHHAESNTRDRHRRQALGAVYSELMMVGVVSFLLILTGELGLQDLRIGSCSDPPAPAENATKASTPPVVVLDPNATLAPPTLAPPTPVPRLASEESVSGSGSGSEECGVGFDIILFEYAHLVLFFMGLTYCAFIMIAFWQRDVLCRRIEIHQQSSLNTWFYQKPKPSSVVGIMGFYCSDGGPWARSILTLRAAIVVEHEQALKDVCDPARMVHERYIAAHRKLEPPVSLPLPEDAAKSFDMARFCKIAMSEVLVELLHIPPVVWFAVLIIASSGLVARAGVDLAAAIVISSFFGPLLALFLLWRLAIQLGHIIRRSAGHPKVPLVDFNGSEGVKADKLNILPHFAQEGLAWSRGGEDPWAILTGCVPDESCLNPLDPLDPGALEHQIQVVIFASCFYVGQVCMLSSLIFDHIGYIGILCWLMPIPPLVFFVPRALLLYTLVHKTKEPPESWLRYALQTEDDPEEPPLVGTDFHDNDSDEDWGNDVPPPKLELAVLAEPAGPVNIQMKPMSPNANSYTPIHPQPTVYSPVHGVTPSNHRQPSLSSYSMHFSPHSTSSPLPQYDSPEPVASSAIPAGYSDRYNPLGRGNPHKNVEQIRPY